MQITHEQARKLIQFSLDGVLQTAERAMLSAHLQECLDCRDYASDLKEVEMNLLPVMEKHWKARPIPLSLPLLVQSKTSIVNTSKLLTMRSAVLSLIFVAFFFSAWKFVSSSPDVSGQIPLAIPLVPTPSTQSTRSTNTASSPENCEMLVYRVQPNDTLASIASHFLVPEDKLIQINGLSTDSLSSSMELVIPVCNFTPTRTIRPATFTATNTPILRATTFAPGG
jgi:hypothetical protein